MFRLIREIEWVLLTLVIGLGSEPDLDQGSTQTTDKVSVRLDRERVLTQMVHNQEKWETMAEIALMDQELDLKGFTIIIILLQIDKFLAETILVLLVITLQVLGG